MSGETLAYCFFAFLAIMLAAYLILDTACPKCGKYFAKRVVKKTPIAKRTTVENVQSRSPRNDGSNPPVWDYVSTDYELTFTKFREDCKCTKCEHTWDEIVEKQTGKRKLSSRTL